LSALLTDGVVHWLERAYGVDRAPSSERYRERLKVMAQNRYSLVINQPRMQGEWHSLNTFLGAMQSLRDTDDPASIAVVRPREAAVLRRLIRG
jgi:hypothetical protein